MAVHNIMYWSHEGGTQFLEMSSMTTNVTRLHHICICAFSHIPGSSRIEAS